MKYLLSILLVIISLGLQAQTYPTPPTQQGSKGTLIANQGGLRIDSTMIPPVYTDTTSANTSRTHNYAGAVIRVGNDYYFRSSDVSRWILFSSGGSSNCPPNGIISPPGSVTWSGVNYIFDALPIDYNINCNHYHSSATTLTIANGDVTNPRIDVVIVDTNNICTVLQGIASNPAVAPVPNPISQLAVTYVYVPAGSTSPSPGQSITMIYNEGVEWTLATNGTVNPLYATSPCYGSVSALVSNAVDGTFLSWQNGSTLDLTDYPYTKFFIKQNSIPTNTSRTRLTISYYNSATQVTTTFVVQNGTYGFDATSTGSCQLVVLPNYLLAGTAPITFDKIYISLTGASASFQLDKVYLLSGAVIPPQQSDSWLKMGNAATNPALDFIGTTDSTDFVQRTNNQIREITPASGFGLVNDTTWRVMLWNPTTKLRGQTYFPTIRALSPLVIVDSSNNHTYIECPTCGTGSGGWGLTGNSGTTAGTNFLGTTDNVDMVFKRNSTIAGRLGTSNTSFGVNSNASITSGANNIGIGVGANNGTTTGNGNVGIGNASLLQVNGGDNIGIGRNAGSNLITGTDNTLVGANILTTSPSNTSNIVAIGNTALQVNTTGSNHTIIGKGAFVGNTTGTHNTALGYLAGVTNTTGGNNLLLGYQADVATSSTVSSIALGYNAISSSNRFTVSDSTTSYKFPNIPAGVGTQALRYDPATGLISRADTSSGGGTPAGNTGNLQIKGIDGNFYTPGGDSLNWVNGLYVKGDIVSTTAVRVGGSTLISEGGISSNTTGLYNIDDNGIVTYNSSTGIYGLGASALNVDGATGFVGIGTTTPTVALDVVGDIQQVGITNLGLGGSYTAGVFTANSSGFSAMGDWQEFVNRNYIFVDDVNYQVKLRARNAGGVEAIIDMVGGANTTYSNINGHNFSSGAVRMSDYGAGIATFDASGNITSVSDTRLKKNITPYYYGLSAVKKLNPIQYQWNGLGKEKHDTLSYYAGFSAQNVKANLPLSTGTNKEGYLSLQDRAILAATINAIKELSAKVDAQAKEIRKLKAKKKK